MYLTSCEEISPVDFDRIHIWIVALTSLSINTCEANKQNCALHTKAIKMVHFHIAKGEVRQIFHEQNETTVET